MGKQKSSAANQPMVVGRWRHRLIDGKLPEPARRLEDPPHNILANPIRIKPQPYPIEGVGDFYFKHRKRFHLVYRGKIGTYEQWSKVTGVSIDNLRARVRSGLSMDEVMSKASLIKLDHAKNDTTAEKYCRCAHCLKKRVLAWNNSLEPLETANPDDAGKIFRRNDGTLFIKLNGKVLDIQSIAKHLGLKYQTLHARVFRYGWPLEKALQGSLLKS